MNTSRKESICPACIVSPNAKAVPGRVCKETGMSDYLMRINCPAIIRRATDTDCHIIPGKETLMPPAFLSKMKISAEQKTREQKERLGKKN